MRARDVYFSKAHIRKIVKGAKEYAKVNEENEDMILAEGIFEIVADALSNFTEYVDTVEARAKAETLFSDMERKHK